MLLKLIPDNTKIKFLNKRLICLIFSVLLLVGTVYSLATKGMNFGIDFTGGIIIEIETQESIKLSDLRDALGKDASLQKIDNSKQVLIRLQPNPDKDNKEVIEDAKNKLAQAINGEIDYRKIDFVGPQVGNELIETALFALLASFGAMLIYIWLRFEWQYGVGAIAALLHDAVALIGFYSITGFEFNLSSVAAILTVIGYSINDSVVIYDRVRENLRKYKKMELEDLLDLSVNDTLSRTIITAGTTLLALGAIIYLGGSVLESFAWGMFFGVIIGTYSSIYIAAITLLYIDPRVEDETEGASDIS